MTPVTDKLKLRLVRVDSVDRSDTPLFGVKCERNSQLIVLPATPRELVYIQPCFLSELSLAVCRRGTRVSGVRGSRDVKTFDWVRFTLPL